MKVPNVPYFNGSPYGSRLRFDPRSLWSVRYDHPPFRPLVSLVGGRVRAINGLPRFVRKSNLARRHNGCKVSLMRERSYA